jgi:thioredoxin-related protein
MKRRQFIAAMPVLSAWAALHKTSAIAAASELPTSKSLQNDIAAALKTSKPLVVLVSLDNCPFCKIARESYLLPLMREQGISVVQVNLGYSIAIMDAVGKQTTQAELIKAWAVNAAPTVLFLAKNGQEIAPRLVGGTTSDFYGAYLQERVDQAVKTLSLNLSQR